MPLLIMPDKNKRCKLERDYTYLQANDVIPISEQKISTKKVKLILKFKVEQRLYYSFTFLNKRF